MPGIDYSYKRCPTLAKFAQSKAYVRGVMGAYGSGKSSACVMEIIRKSLEQRKGLDGIRRTRWAVIRNTYRQLADTTMKTVFDWLPEKTFGRYKVVQNCYYITAFPDTEIEILFRALDKPEDVDNLASLELTGAWCNEAREIPLEIIEALTGRVGRFPAIKNGGCPWAGIIMDTNPPDDESWWFSKSEVEVPKHWEFFKQPSGLSPEAENLLTEEDEKKIIADPHCNIVGGLSHDYYIKLAEGKDKSFVDVYVRGKYGIIKRGMPVYENSYNDDLHIAKNIIQPILNSPIIIGMDFGLTPAAVFTQYNSSGQFIALEEKVAFGMGMEQFLQTIINPIINSKYRDYEVLVIGDPSGISRSDSDETSCFDILKRYNYSAEPARSNSTITRLGAVEYFLNSLSKGKPRLIVSPNCKLLRKGFMGGYCYRRMKVSGEKYADIPDKNRYSHVHDALQYAALHFEYSERKPKYVPIAVTTEPASSYVGY